MSWLNKYGVQEPDETFDKRKAYRYTPNVWKDSVGDKVKYNEKANRAADKSGYAKRDAAFRSNAVKSRD